MNIEKNNINIINYLFNIINITFNFIINKKYVNFFIIL